MIARIKKTGKLIYVVPYSDEFVQLLPEGDFEVYTKKELAKLANCNGQTVEIDLKR